MEGFTDPDTGPRCLQAMLRMRDGVRLNTFALLPSEGGPSFPVILHRTPYGIAAADARDKFDGSRAWLPHPAEPMRGSFLRGWKATVGHGYAAVYQDCRGRHGSEGEDRVYADDAADGHDTLDWIAAQPWCNGRIGMSGSSAGATTTFAAASTRHPALRAFFAQAGASSIYDDVVYEGQSIEMERLWLWVARNIPGLSRSHREAVIGRFGTSTEALGEAAASAVARYERLEAARRAERPFVASADWLCAERWPPPGTRPERLYLRGDGSISAAGPGGAARSYDYDPRQPIPTLGGRNMLIDAGPRDQRPAQSLPDYGLIYRGEELPR